MPNQAIYPISSVLRMAVEPCWPAAEDDEFSLSLQFCHTPSLQYISRSIIKGSAAFCKTQAKMYLAEAKDVLRRGPTWQDNKFYITKRFYFEVEKCRIYIIVVPEFLNSPYLFLYPPDSFATDGAAQSWLSEWHVGTLNPDLLTEESLR